MVDYLKEAKRGEHASASGAVIAFDLGNQLGIPSFIIDPVSVDEMEPIARISGMADIERTCIFHALNQKAIARQVAEEKHRIRKAQSDCCPFGRRYQRCLPSKRSRSMSTMRLTAKGDVDRRSGRTAWTFIQDVLLGKYTLEEIKRKNYGQGGIVSYLGTNVREVLK